MRKIITAICILLSLIFVVSCSSDIPENKPDDTTVDNGAVTGPGEEEDENNDKEEKRKYDESEYPIEELVLWGGESLEFVVLEGKNFTAENGITLPYRIYIPDDYDESKKYPVLLYLHGRGTSGDDNILHLNDVKKVFLSSDSPAYDSIVIAPHCPLEGWWGYDYNDAVVELVEDLGEKYSIDFDRIYSTGNSMGGAGSFDLALRHSDFVTAVLPAAHGSFDYETWEDYEANIPMNFDPQILDVPMYFIYDLTDKTVWYEPIQKAIQYIKDQGGEKVEYKETFGLDHQVGDVYISRDDLSGLEWLYSKVKGSDTPAEDVRAEAKKNKEENIKYIENDAVLIPDTEGVVDVSGLVNGGAKIVTDVTKETAENGVYIGYKKYDYEGNGIAVLYFDNRSDVDCNITIRTTYHDKDGKKIDGDIKSHKGLLVGENNHFIFAPGFDFETCKYQIVIESVGDGEILSRSLGQDLFCLGEDVSSANGDHIAYATVNVESNSQYIMFATIRCIVLDKNGEIVHLSDDTYPIIQPDVGAEPSLNGMCPVILYRGKEPMPENWMDDYTVIYSAFDLNRVDHTKN